jgi:hypothetical protein
MGKFISLGDLKIYQPAAETGEDIWRRVHPWTKFARRTIIGGSAARLIPCLLILPKDSGDAPSKNGNCFAISAGAISCKQGHGYLKDQIENCRQ